MKIIAAILLLSSISCLGEIIPAARRITWQDNAGIPGGIPIRTTIFTNVWGVSSNGSSDVSATLQSLLDACPSNQVVYIPAGIYRCNSTLTVNSFTTLRGAGTNTQLRFYNTDEKIQFGASTRYYNDGNTTYYNVSGSPAVGATTIAMYATNADIAVGNLLLIDQLNDGVGPPLGTNLVTIEAGDQSCTHCSRSSGTRAMMQVVLITGTSGTNITFSPGLYYPRRSTLDPEAAGFALNGQWIGCEDLKVSAMTESGGNADGANFNLNVVKYCWVKNCEGDYTTGDHVKVTTSFRCEIRDSYFHDGFAHGPGEAEAGCMIGMGSGSLYENNIIRRNHVPLYLNWGAAGNVIGYNYFDGAYSTSVPNHVRGGILWHGSHPMMNLIEGNVTEHVFQDQVWGNASHETVFRNFITGVAKHNGPYDTRGTEDTTYVWPNYARFCINMGWGTRNFNFVGNIIGHYNARTNWSSTAGPGNGTPVLAEYSVVSPAEYDSYQTASWLIVAGYYNAYEDTNAWETAYLHGNWDVVNESVAWDSDNADHSIPDSLYLSSKPSWFGILNYPPVNAETHTISTNPNTNLPAYYRYTYGTNPPAAGQQSAPTGRVGTVRAGIVIVR